MEKAAERTLRMCKIIFSEGKVHLYTFNAIEKKSTFEMSIEDCGKTIRRMIKKDIVDLFRCESGRCVIYTAYENKDQMLIRGAVEYTKHLQSKINQNLKLNEIMMSHVEALLDVNILETVKEEEWTRY